MKAPSKYRNVKTEVDGITFASKAEAKRYSELKLLERAGKIKELHLQPRYPLTVEGEKICTYVGDFLYRDPLTGNYVLEDVKGVRTAAYNIKRKLVKAIYKIDIVEVRNR